MFKKEELQYKKFTAVICIKNLSIPQSIALEDMLSMWQTLGSLGASRWTSFFADGDGDFRPNVLYNGHAPNSTILLGEEEKWRDGEYKIDFDSVAWKLHDNETTRYIEEKSLIF
jgi:hypothetical protein